MKIIEADITQFPHFQKYSSETCFTEEIFKSIVLSTSKILKHLNFLFKVIFTYNHVVPKTFPAKTIE